MPSFTTIYRAVVMLAVGAIVLKGWQLYGPSAEQVKSVAVSAIDMAQTAWKNRPSSGGEEHPATESRGAAPPFAQSAQPTVGLAIVPPALSTQSITPIAPVGVVPSTSPPMSREPITPVGETSAATGANDDQIHTLLSRLEQLGGAESKVGPWGSSGHLFRCCCRAPLTNSPAVTQHFESVAAEPALAVEQVVAQVEAWRTAQRNDTSLR